MSPERRTLDPLAKGYTAVSNVLALAGLPGFVAHELGHYLLCRALGIDVGEVVLFDWPTNPTKSRPSAYVAYARPDAPWKAALVGFGPLLSNTAGALAFLLLARRLLEPELAVDGLSTVFTAYWSAFLAGDPLQQVAVALAGWVGIALAFHGFPSKTDLRNIGHQLNTRLQDDDISTRLGHVVSHIHTELAMLYTLGVALLGLTGRHGTRSIPGGIYVELLVLGLPILGWRLLTSADELLDAFIGTKEKGWILYRRRAWHLRFAVRSRAVSGRRWCRPEVGSSQFRASSRPS